jgi:lipid-binding SYLF domain-containing protein
MKIIWTFLLTLSLGGTAMAVDKAELDQRIRKLTMKFAEMQSKADKSVPASVLRKAKGIVLLDRTKAGFVFAYQSGNGVALAKDASGKWSAPAFVSANEGSLGLQVGGQQALVVVLLMNTNAVIRFAEGTLSYGGTAGGTAGNEHGKVEGDISPTEKDSLVYTDAEGLYGGAAFKVDAISSDTKAGNAYYGEFFTMRELLIGGKGKPTPASTQLTQKIDELAK